MPLCTNCAQAVSYLYTVYHSVNNVRLEQCVRHLHFQHYLTESSHDALCSRYSLHAVHLQILMSSMTP